MTLPKATTTAHSCTSASCHFYATGHLAGLELWDNSCAEKPLGPAPLPAIPIVGGKRHHTTIVEADDDPIHAGAGAEEDIVVAIPPTAQHHRDEERRKTRSKGRLMKNWIRACWAAPD
jgi:hypothetical protein